MSPLPDERNTTYTAKSQVKSDDLNDIQDEIVALSAGSTLILAALDGQVEGASVLSDGRVSFTSTSDRLYLSPRLPVGFRVTGWRVRVADGGDASFDARDVVMTTSLAAHGNADSSSGGGTNETLEDGSFDPYEIAAGESYLLELSINSSSASSVVYWAEFDFERV